MVHHMIMALEDTMYYERRPDLDALRERVRPIVEDVPGITGLSIYGSRARGDWVESSDYDFMAVLEPDPEDGCRWLTLAGRLERELGARVDVCVAERQDDRWRRRMVADLRWVWGEPVDWSYLEPMSREDMERDRLVYQLEYVYHALHDVEPVRFQRGYGFPYDVFAARVIRPINTLRNIDRHSPEVYAERFSHLIPDPIDLQEWLDYDHLHSHRYSFEDIRRMVPFIREQAGRQLDAMGWPRPGPDWDNGLHPPG